MGTLIKPLSLSRSSTIVDQHLEMQKQKKKRKNIINQLNENYKVLVVKDYTNI